MCHTQEGKGAIILNMPSALPPGPCSPTRQDVIDPGAWLTEFSLPICPDKEEANSPSAWSEPLEYQKFPMDGVTCREQQRV